MTKLEKMLKYVSEHNEFYKKRIKEYGIKDPLDITQWPVLTRKELQENRYNMFSDGYKSKYYNQQLKRQSSSGSTGMPVNVYWDYKDWYASNMSLWRMRWEWYGIKPSDKYVMFTLNIFNMNDDAETIYHIKEANNVLAINISLIQNADGYDSLVDIINEFEPSWLYIQPSILNKLVQAYKISGKRLPKSLKYIESVGEILTSDLRRRVVDFFNVPIINMYGSEEMNGIAYECQNRHMHVLGDNVLVEVVTSTGISSSGNGETIITNLNNHAMPLIRYCQGDYISLTQSGIKCPFQRDKKQIEIINGRKSGSFCTASGTEIFSYLLTEIISEVNNEFCDPILNYKYIYQKTENKLQCYITVQNKAWLKRIERKIYSIFADKTGVKELNIEVLANCSTISTPKNSIIEIKE